MIYRCRNDESILKITISCPATDALTLYTGTLKSCFIDIKTIKTCPKNGDLKIHLKAVLRRYSEAVIHRCKNYENVLQITPTYFCFPQNVS